METEGKSTRDRLKGLMAEDGESGPSGYICGPERNLFAALLFDGVMSCISYALANNKSQARRYREAYYWVFGDASEHIFSFGSVCEALGVHPTGLRLGIANAVTSQTGEWRRLRRKEPT